MPPLFHPDVPLTALNTFGLVARARRLATLSDEAQLPALLADNDFRHGPRLLLGGGSNLLLTHTEVNASVLRIATQGIRLLADDGEQVQVEAAAGESWHGFVRHTLQHGWFGLENLSLIPGTVGASPIQNIGAYGVEVKDRLHSLRALSLDDGQMHEFAAGDCAFAYRDSLFKQQAGRWLVLAVRFTLSRRAAVQIDYGELRQDLAEHGVSAPTPLEVSDAVMRVRQRKLPDPAELGNAGSFFKNPVVDAAHAAALLAQWPDLPHYPQADGRVKLAAGWLIDRAGWKGRRLGPAGVHARQALVLVNHGGATGADIVALAEAIAADVRQRYGVALEAEPVRV